MATDVFANGPSPWSCTACEGSPKPGNDPCCVCGRQTIRPVSLPPEPLTKEKRTRPTKKRQQELAIAKAMCNVLTDGDCCMNNPGSTLCTLKNCAMLQIASRARKEWLTW